MRTIIALLVTIFCTISSATAAREEVPEDLVSALEELLMFTNEIGYELEGKYLTVYPKKDGWDGGIKLIFQVSASAGSIESWPAVSIWAKNRQEQVFLRIPRTANLLVEFQCGQLEKQYWQQLLRQYADEKNFVMVSAESLIAVTIYGTDKCDPAPNTAPIPPSR